MKKTPTMQSLLYAGDLLAVDLGSFSVKVMHLRAKERSLTVFGSAQAEVWRALADAKTDEEKTEVYAAALRQLLAAHGFKTRNASISLSGGAVVVRFLPVPAGFTQDPDLELPAEARALIPFDEPDAAVSALILDSLPGIKKPRPEMVLAAAQRKSVQSGMDIVRKAGLRPAVIINDVLALANAYEFFQGKKKDETVVLVNAGSASTSVVVMEHGVPRAARVLNISGSSFTRAVKREFSVEFEEAERLKISHGLAAAEGLSLEDAAVAARVARSLRPAVKDLGGEIQRTIDVFLERRPADYPPVRRIVLAGGSAELRGLSELLAGDTGMPVEVFRPMVNVTGKGGVLGISALAAAFAVPCGLALSNTLLGRSHRARINLVPRKVRRSAIIRDISPGFWKLIAGPVLVVLALCVYGVWAVRVSHKEAAEEQRLEAAAKKDKAQQTKFLKKKAAAVVKKPADPYAYLSRLSISGVIGDSRNSQVMLDGGGKVYVARSGKLFDANEEAVPGVASEIRDNSLALTAGGRRYKIELPK